MGKRKQDTEPLVTHLKTYNLQKDIKNLLKQINPLLRQKNDVRIHLEALRNNLISEEAFLTIEAKMKLGHMALGLESLIDDVYVTILFYDKEHNMVYHGAAPSIPVDFFDFFATINENHLLNENCASCGHALYTKETVYTDIHTSPLWANFKDYILQWGFQTCLSIPFFINGEVCGTFANYSKTRSKTFTEEEVEAMKFLIKGYETEIYHLSQKLAEAPKEKKISTHRLLDIALDNMYD